MLRAFITAFSSVIMLSLVASANASLDDDLVFYLTFDNVKNQTILDESGNGLDAVWQRTLSDDEVKHAMVGNFLAVSPSDKVATTWADMKRRAVAP